jgi:hypothetical protein
VCTLIAATAIPAPSAAGRVCDLTAPFRKLRARHLAAAPRRVGKAAGLKVPDCAVHAVTATGPAPARLMIAGASRRMHAWFFMQIGMPVAYDRTPPAKPDGPRTPAHAVSVARERAVTTRELAPRPAGPT